MSHRLKIGAYSMFNLKTRYRKAAAAVTIGAVAVLTSPMAQAAGVDGLFDEIDLSGVTSKVVAAAVLIVGIAFAIQGPAIVKRLISKI
jgi:hypothetical protein